MKSSVVNSHPRPRRIIIGLLLTLAWLFVASAQVLAAGPGIVVLTAKGAVTPAMAGYIDRGIGEAEARGAIAVVLQLDTPGGLDTAMRDIVQRINNARVPVIVFVGPAGARAASAGAFITLAAPVAVMAPNTAIGAAHPVGGGGQQIEGPLKDKVVNDAVAYIRGIAQLRGRNAGWAERAVRESISASAEEAVAMGVVDFMAVDVNEVLSKLDGRRVRLLSGEVVLHSQGEPAIAIGMNPIESLLQAIADPNIAYLLLSLAMLGLFLELSHPGLLLPGILGGISLLLAFYALGTLPFNIAGLLLIGLGFLFLGAEIWITSHGLLAVGGLVSLTLGSFILFSGAGPNFQINPLLILAVVGGLGLFFFLMLGAVIRSRRNTQQPALDRMAGSRGWARTDLRPEGTVLVHGELWSARTSGEPIAAGERIEVLSLDGMTLEVVRPSDR